RRCAVPRLVSRAHRGDLRLARLTGAVRDAYGSGSDPGGRTAPSTSATLVESSWNSMPARLPSRQVSAPANSPKRLHRSTTWEPGGGGFSTCPKAPLAETLATTQPSSPAACASTPDHSTVVRP